MEPRPHLVIGFASLRRGDPDRYALAAIAQVLGGQGGRLFDSAGAASTREALHKRLCKLGWPTGSSGGALAPWLGRERSRELERTRRAACA
jgi:hypothetical protein